MHIAHLIIHFFLGKSRRWLWKTAFRTCVNNNLAHKCILVYYLYSWSVIEMFIAYVRYVNTTSYMRNRISGSLIAARARLSTWTTLFYIIQFYFLFEMHIRVKTVFNHFIFRARLHIYCILRSGQPLRMRIIIKKLTQLKKAYDDSWAAIT